MSEVKKQWETPESLISTNDLPKEWAKKYDPEVFKRILDEVKRLEAEDDHFLDDNDIRINKFPEIDKLYPEDKKLFIKELPKNQFIDYLEADPKIENKSKLKEMLSEKVSEIEWLLTELELRKKQMEWKGDELSFQWELDTLFTKISLALFIAESIDDKNSISRLHMLESQAMNLWWNNQRINKNIINKYDFEK